MSDELKNIVYGLKCNVILKPIDRLFDWLFYNDILNYYFEKQAAIYNYYFVGTPCKAFDPLTRMALMNSGIDHEEIK